MATQNLARRTVILDIESASLNPANPTGALDAMTGRIVCIGLLFDDGRQLVPNPICDTDERKLLERFWAALSETDLLVGHNILEFDLMFIRQRSWILGVRPQFEMNLKKYYTTQVCDLMSVWTNWSNRFKGASLDNIARALGVGEKTGNGACIATWWANRDFDSIVKYCMADCDLTYHCYCRMHYRQPLGSPLPIEVEQPAARVPQVPIPLPQRELVPVPRVRPAAATAVNTFPPEPNDRPPVRVQGFASAAPAYTNRESRPARTRRNRITYAEMGGALILAGGTFPLKDALAALGGRCSKGDEGKWVWQVPAAKFEALAALCVRNSVQLVPAA